MEDFNPLGGLKNFGSNCYLNTIVQCLRYSNSMRKLFSDNENDSIVLNKVRELQENNMNEIEKYPKLKKKIDYYCVYFTFKKLIHDLLHNSETQTPETFVRACYKLSKHTNQEYLFQDQNDINECIIFLIDAIHEAKASKISMVSSMDDKNITTMEQKIKFDSYQTYKNTYESQYSWLVEEYYFMIMTNINCNQCKNKLFNYSPHNLLTLPIPDEDERGKTTLYDCLDHYFGKEVFDNKNQWKCEKCENKEDNYKQYRITATPPTLIITLKRYEDLGNRWKKINKMIDFPIELDISNYKLGRNKTDCQYKLFAIGNHVGEMNFGHCYAYCRNIQKQPDTWYEYNDVRVSKMDDKNLFTSNAYLLLYERC
jgi:ubiquitin C-terminal hydrolase